MSACAARPTCSRASSTRAAPAGSRVAVETGEQREVPPSGQVRIEGGRLHEAGDPVGYRSGRRVQTAAEETHGAGVAPDESEQDAHQRGLSGAVRAEEPVQPTGPGDEVDAAEGVAVPVALGHADGLERDWSAMEAHDGARPRTETRKRTRNVERPSYRRAPRPPLRPGEIDRWRMSDIMEQRRARSTVRP